MKEKRSAGIKKRRPVNVLGMDEGILEDGKNYYIQVLKFHENVRPGFYGNWVNQEYTLNPYISYRSNNQKIKCYQAQKTIIKGL